MLTPPIFAKSIAGQLTYKVKNIEQVEGDISTSIFLQRKVNKRIMACEPDSGPALPNTILDHLVVSKDAKINEREFGSTMNINGKCCPEDAKYRNTVYTPKEKRPCRRDQASTSMAQKLQRNHDNKHIKEKRGSSTSVFPKVSSNLEYLYLVLYLVAPTSVSYCVDLNSWLIL